MTSSGPTRRFIAALATLLLLPPAILTAGDRFYFGEARPRDEVAFFLADRRCSVSSLTPEGQREVSLTAKLQGELLPGSYRLCVGFVQSGLLMSRGCASLTVDAVADHTYYIYPEIGKESWAPRALDLASAQDFETHKDGPAIRKRVLKYFEGKREAIHQTKLGYWD